MFLPPPKPILHNEGRKEEEGRDFGCVVFCNVHGLQH